MVRTALTSEQRLRGRALGAAIQQLRTPISAEQLAMRARVRVDTVRKIERGAIATPGFFVIADIAGQLEVTLDDLVLRARQVAAELEGDGSRTRVAEAES